MTAAPKDNRRRQYYIKRDFQRRFILQFCGVVAIGCTLFGTILYAYASRTLTTAFVQSKLRVMSTADFLMPALAFTTLVVMALVALAVGMRLLLLSHKIAGPLYRLEQSAKTIGTGDLRLQVRLRQGDQLQEMAQTMDDMVAQLRQLMRLVQDENRRLREVIRDARQAPSVPQELLEQLEGTQARLDGAINRFRV